MNRKKFKVLCVLTIETDSIFSNLDDLVNHEIIFCDNVGYSKYVSHLYDKEIVIKENIRFLGLTEEIEKEFNLDGDGGYGILKKSV